MITVGIAPRAWTLHIIAPCAWLTANIERSRLERARKVKAWREQTVAACMVGRLPKGITPVDISAVVRYSTRQAPVRDRLNLAPTLKAIVDGLTPARSWTRDGKRHYTPGYGLLPDDSDRHVLNTAWELARLEPTADRPLGLPAVGVVELTIREVAR